MTTTKNSINSTDLRTLERNKVTVRKLMEAVNNHDLTPLDDLVESDYVNQQMRIRSVEDFKAVLREQYRGVPDVHRTIEDIVAEGDMVWLRVKITGTHTGEYRGVPPTGKKIVMPAVPAYRVSNGKLTEGWSVWNPLDLFKQLGVVEYKGFPDVSSGSRPTIARRSSNE
jgi:predicted ester cyclase